MPWGRSGAPLAGFGIRDLALDTLAVIGAIELDDYMLVGHSMGGKVAQVVASCTPPGLRGVVLVAPAPAAPAAPIPDAARQQILDAYSSRDTVRRALDAVLTHRELDPTLREQVVDDSLAGTPEARRTWPMSAISEDVSDGLGAIDVPVLVVGADHDNVEPVSLLEEHVVPSIVGSRLEVVSGCGHLIPLEAPEELAHMVREFVATSQ